MRQNSSSSRFDRGVEAQDWRLHTGLRRFHYGTGHHGASNCGRPPGTIVPLARERYSDSFSSRFFCSAKVRKCRLTTYLAVVVNLHCTNGCTLTRSPRPRRQAAFVTLVSPSAARFVTTSNLVGCSTPECLRAPCHNAAGVGYSQRDLTGRKER